VRGIKKARNPIRMTLRVDPLEHREKVQGRGRSTLRRLRLDAIKVLPTPVNVYQKNDMSHLQRAPMLETHIETSLQLLLKRGKVKRLIILWWIYRKYLHPRYKALPPKHHRLIRTKLSNCIVNGSSHLGTSLYERDSIYAYTAMEVRFVC